MEHTVTGCEDCPLYDSASGEYILWCHHPDRPIEITKYNGIPGHWNFIPANLPIDVFEKIRKENAVNGSEYLQKYQEDNEVHLYIKEPEIFSDSDNDYKKITPEWCPLKQEPITVSIKSENNAPWDEPMR